MKRWQLLGDKFIAPGLTTTVPQPLSGTTSFPVHHSCCRFEYEQHVWVWVWVWVCATCAAGDDSCGGLGRRLNTTTWTQPTAVVLLIWISREIGFSLMCAETFLAGPNTVPLTKAWE